METPDPAWLIDDGFITIPILEDKGVRAVWREAFLEATTRFPEYRRDGSDPLRTVDGESWGTKHSNYVMGGFGGFGNPSSFHNPYVRALRMLVHTRMIPFFNGYLRHRCSVYDPHHADFPTTTEGFYLEQLFCRMCLRPEGTSVTREQWHRDLNPTAQKDDIVFGGWINLDDQPQWFSCAPATHNDVVEATKGFSKQPAPTDRRHIQVPPGHLLVFYQRLLHEVAPRIMRWQSFRQFICWRITREPGSSLQHEPLEDILTRQGVPRLPSHQIPPLFGMNHTSFHLHKDHGPIRWSDRLLDPRCTADLSDTKGYRIGHRYMKSLADYGFPLYHPYSDTERSILTPRREWHLPDLTNVEWTLDTIRTFSYAQRPLTIFRIAAAEQEID